MEYLFGGSDEKESEAQRSSTTEPRASETETSFMGWLIGCGGGSQVYEDDMNDVNEEDDSAMMRMGLCGMGMSGQIDQGKAGERVGSRMRTSTYEEDDLIVHDPPPPPRIIVLGGADKDQRGGVGRDLVIPRGALGTVTLNNVRPSVFDDPASQSEFQAILNHTSAAIVSVDKG